MNKSKFTKQLIIGSANFVQKYGVDSRLINKDEIKKILYLAKINNINKIDTADSYLNKSNIFKRIDNKFQFITKINPDKKWISLDYCQKKIQEHFKRFNTNKIHTLLVHDIDVLFRKSGPKIFENHEKLKKKNFFKKIGISIYDPECLNYLIPNYNIDVVQCPYNILDKRIVRSGWFNRLKNKEIEIHARSIFLQGLLVNESLYKKKYFKKWKKFFFKWFENLKDNDISPISYCLSDLLDYNFDKIIIGISNSDNLKNIINFKKAKNRNKILDIKINDLKLIDPRNWK